MGLFSRTKDATADPADVEHYRGKADEIGDGGSLPWEVVFASLEIDGAPPVGDDAHDDPLDVVVGLLALAHDEDRHRGTFNRNATVGPWTEVFHGVRHGRPVLLNQGSQRSGSKGALVAWVCAATPSISIVPDDGRLVADARCPTRLPACSPRWRHSPRSGKTCTSSAGPTGSWSSARSACRCTRRAGSTTCGSPSGSRISPGSRHPRSRLALERAAV